MNRFVRVILPAALSVAAYSCAPQARTPTAGTTTICDGTWEVVQSPSSGAENEALTAVAATSLTDVWAVGWADTGELSQTLIEHWDGAAWTIVPSPQVEGQSTALLAADALAGGDAWGVGYSEDVDGVRSPLIVQWDGQAWGVVPSPRIDVGDSELAGVAALDKDSAWAVGYYSAESGVRHTLILHWDGATWSVTENPTGVDGDELLGVDSLGANDLWAVGRSGPANASALRPTTQHWDGQAWSTVDAEPQAGEGFMVAVAAVSPTDVWTVGADGTMESGAIRAPAGEHGDGKGWTRADVPRPTAGDARLSGVAAGRSDQAWAVGYQTSPETHSRQTLALFWDGKAWSVAATPNVSAESNVLTAVGQTQSHYWAVGSYESDGALRTLIEHSCLEPGQP